MKKYRYSQDILRIFGYVLGGYSSAIFPWYFGLPLLFSGILLGMGIERL